MKRRGFLKALAGLTALFFPVAVPIRAVAQRVPLRFIPEAWHGALHVGFRPGDKLSIETGPDAGLYTITEVKFDEDGSKFSPVEIDRGYWPGGE